VRLYLNAGAQLMRTIFGDSNLRFAVVAIASVLALGLSSGRAIAGDYSKSYTITSRPQVHVVTDDGSVNVSSGDSDQVEFHVEYQGWKLDKSLRIESHQEGDRVELTAHILGHTFLSIGNWRNLHIEVRVPKDADIQVETGDGAITAREISGSVDLRTGDGRVSVRDLKGSLRIRTGDGSVEGSNLDGQCEATSGDGRIHLAGRFDVLAVHSGDGSIDAAATSGSTLRSPWKIQSGDGGITLAIPGDLSADIDASTGGGHISADIPVAVDGVFSESHVRGKLNGGGPSLTVHSGDGSIHLTKT
jgi:DUF4097 and DUF4098 domain-containing protein YvlB